MNENVRHANLKVSTHTKDVLIDDMIKLLSDTCLDLYQSSLDARKQLNEVRLDYKTIKCNYPNKGGFISFFKCHSQVVHFTNRLNLR